MSPTGWHCDPVQLQLRHLTLSGWQSGASHLPLCLCVHGWLDNANSFIPLAQQLSHCRILAIDLPGHGHSQHRSQDAHYHFFDWVDDLFQCLQVMDAGPVHLIGHSMGGMIGTAFAAGFGEWVKSLILLDSAGFITASEQQTSQQLRQAVLSRQKRFDKRKPRYADLQQAALARMAQGDLDLPSAMLLAQRGSQTVDGQITWSADLRLRETSAYRLSMAQATQLVQDVQVPVLALTSRNPTSPLATEHARFLKFYQNLQWHEFDAGHHLHMTHAASVAAVIERFLSKCHG